MTAHYRSTHTKLVGNVDSTVQPRWPVLMTLEQHLNIAWQGFII